MSSGVIGGSLREDNRDIAASLAVSLQPGIQLALGVVALPLRGVLVDPHFEDVGESLRWRGLWHETYPQESFYEVSEVKLMSSISFAIIRSMPRPTETASEKFSGARAVRERACAHFFSWLLQLP